MVLLSVADGQRHSGGRGLALTSSGRAILAQRPDGEPGAADQDRIKAAPRPRAFRKGLEQLGVQVTVPHQENGSPPPLPTAMFEGEPSPLVP